MIEIYALSALTSLIVFIVASITTEFGERVQNLINTLIISPGKEYWATRLDALGDASLYAGLGSLTTDFLKITSENMGITYGLLMFMTAFGIFLMSNAIKARSAG